MPIVVVLCIANGIKTVFLRRGHLGAGSVDLFRNCSRNSGTEFRNSLSQFGLG